MNKKPLDTLLQHPNFNESLFRQSISIVQTTKNIIPVSKIPIEMMKQKTAAQLKKKQQTIQTQLSKSIKLFGQILGVSKNSYGTMGDFAIQIYDQLTDLIETSCHSFVDKKKNIKVIEKQKQQISNQSTSNAQQNSSFTRPQDRFPSIKPALFDRHSHQLAPVENTPLCCAEVQPSVPISQPFIYVSTKQGLQKMVMQLSSCKEIAVDLQHSNKSYEGLTCLIQVSSRQKDYIIDVFCIWQHIPMLKALIQNQNIVKVMHGAEMDVKWLQRDFNIHIRNLFDTYKASRVLGYPKFSYAYLLNHYCDTLTDKKYQLADWTQRPLSPEMLKYARMDTHYLLEIWDKLLQDLTKQSKSMNLDPQTTIRQIYKSSHDVTMGQVELFTYKKKQLYQNIKNDTKAQDFEVIQTIYWTIDKVAKQQDQSFDQLINRRTMTDIIGRVKDLIHNKRATIDMLRVKIDRLVGVVRSHKHQKVGLLLAPMKQQLQKYFLQAKKQALEKKKVKTTSIEQAPLIQRLGQEGKRPLPKQGIWPAQQKQQVFTFSKAQTTLQQVDYPLKTYQNFSIQQRLKNKKTAFSLIQFEPIMSFMSKRFNISQRTQDVQQQKGKAINDSQSQGMELQDQENVGQIPNSQKQNQGFLEFKRLKPNVIYAIEQEAQQDKNNELEKKPKKKRKQLEYEEKLRSKEGNIYDLLQDV